MKKIKSEKLQIVMLGHKRIPSREGGVEIVVEELAVRMVQKGYEVTCFNRRGKHVSGENIEINPAEEYKGVHIRTVWTLDKKGLAAMTASAAAAWRAAIGKYDVVHFHAEGPCAMLWLPKLFGKRCIATIHGLDHQRAKWGKLGKAYILLGEKVAAKYADEIIVLSKGVQNYFMETYGRKTIMIPNGVSRAKKELPELISEKFGLEPEKYILFLARLVPEKGVSYLIDAFKKVNTDKKLVIAGGASDSEDFVKLLHEKTEGDDRILFTGFVQGKMLAELYSNAYLYVLPSDVEGMPLSLLEAMSYGNCCLTSDISENTSVTENYGVCFKKSDVKDLTEKLQMLCDQEEMVRTYKDQAADYICRKYDWDDVVTRTIDIYTKKGRIEK